MQPLVVTLVLDDATTRRFDDERRELFPAGRTQVGAHLTLFHAVPGERLAQVTQDLRTAADRPAFDARVVSVMALGRGAAYRLEADELVELHAGLQRSWSTVLTRQDRQGLAAHVTVQNKVDPAHARATVARLSSSFVPFTARALGIALWWYVGGPWRAIDTFRFAGASPVPAQERRQ